MCTSLFTHYPLSATFQVKIRPLFHYPNLCSLCIIYRHIGLVAATFGLGNDICHVYCEHPKCMYSFLNRQQHANSFIWRTNSTRVNNQVVFFSLSFICSKELKRLCSLMKFTWLQYNDEISIVIYPCTKITTLNIFIFHWCLGRKKKQRPNYFLILYIMWD